MGDQFVAPDAADPRDLGQMLWSENVKSLRARYPDSNPEYEAERRGQDRDVAAYEFHEYPCVKPAAIAAIADCYEYQTCEHEGLGAERRLYHDRLTASAARQAAPRLRRCPLGDHRA
jgi:hypothetical protein